MALGARLGRCVKISPPSLLRFDPRIVQPVESRCTDFAILARYIFHNNWISGAALRRGHFTVVEIPGGGGLERFVVAVGRGEL